MQSKRLKLRNGVLAELVEAIRHSAMNADFNKSDTLIKTIEKDISTVIKYSDNICMCCKHSCHKCKEYYSLGITSDSPHQLCEECSKKAIKYKHKIRGDYDCCFLYRVIPVLLYDKDRSSDIIRFYKRMLLSDSIHQEFLLYSIIRYFSFLGDYKQASSTLLKYDFSTSSTYDSDSDSTHYIQFLRVLCSCYEAQSQQRELSTQHYKSFKEALYFATTSESSLIHYTYLTCLLHVNMEDILSQAFSLLQSHPQSSYLPFFLITHIRYAMDRKIKEHSFIQNMVSEVLPNYIESNPTSQSTLFDLILLHKCRLVNDELYILSLFTLIEFLFVTPPLQLYAMHVLCEHLSEGGKRDIPSIQQRIKENDWWMDYLDDSDLRIEYARTILEGESEEQDVDEDVVNFYEQQLELYKDTYNYYLLSFWQ